MNVRLEDPAVPRHSLSKDFKDFLLTLAICGAIFSFVYMFIAQPNIVIGPSMLPTFHDHDYIITDKLSYHFSNPQRGDIIVFKDPRDESQDLIKRIIGLPEENVKIQAGKVYINDQELPQPFVKTTNITSAGPYLTEGKQLRLDQNQYFVLGDNRPDSADSREWGVLERREIIGRVLFRYYPSQAFGFLPGKYQY